MSQLSNLVAKLDSSSSSIICCQAVHGIFHAIRSPYQKEGGDQEAWIQTIDQAINACLRHAFKVQVLIDWPCVIRRQPHAIRLLSLTVCRMLCERPPSCLYPRYAMIQIHPSIAGTPMMPWNCSLPPWPELTLEVSRSMFAPTLMVEMQRGW